MCFLLFPGFLLTSRADPSQNCLKNKNKKRGKTSSLSSCVPHPLSPSYRKLSLHELLTFSLLLLGQSMSKATCLFFEGHDIQFHPWNYLNEK